MSMVDDNAGLEGPRMFCRFAYPPNSLGLCGPTIGDDVDAMFLEPRQEWHRSYATAFDGAWPYLDLIGACMGLDPLDPTVVEAYWLGSDRLWSVDWLAWGNSLEGRFRARAGSEWSRIVSALNDGGVPNHAFHVFCVYPWVGLLRGGRAAPALQVLDRCRIRWGRVVEDLGSTVLVQSQPLTFDGRHLALGVPHVEMVQSPIGTLAGIEVGQAVALHWDYICQPLDDRRLQLLRRAHQHHVRLANRVEVAAAGVTS